MVSYRLRRSIFSVILILILPFILLLFLRRERSTPKMGNAKSFFINAKLSVKLKK